MKALDIALKDLTRSFRSAFAVIFMFGIPLLMAGMFYLMFGGITSDDTGFSMPQTQVVIANLDRGGAEFAATMQNMPNTPNAESLGEMLTASLQSDVFADLMQVQTVTTAAEARQQVDARQAGVAIIIPEDFSAQFSNLTGKASLELYQDPTLTIGPAIVRSVLAQFVESFSGAKVALGIISNHTASADQALIGQVVQGYMAFSMQMQDPTTLVAVQSPIQKEPVNLMVQIIGPILGGMIIFYAFFTGVSTAQTILREDEEGTLPRLFTTPTPTPIILTGKFLAVFLTVVIQLVVMLILGRLIFAIPWGELSLVVCFTCGTILMASSFGIFVNSMLKSTKQGGVVFGGVVTVTGMIGMIKIFTLGGGASPASGTLDIASLFVPQGWAVRGLLQAMNNASLNDALLTLLGMLAWAAVLFVIGVLRFAKRYA